MRVPLVYEDQPMFGFDLGSRTAKMIQLRPDGKKALQVLGYGYANFPAEAIVEGIIVDPEEIVEALAPLMKQMSFGHISSKRVAAAMPVSKVFTRVLELPPMNTADLGAAVRLEAEQYIPVPLPDLYIDYEIIEKTTDHIDVLMVGAPRAIADSYIKLFDLMNLEVAVLESSLSAVTRAIVSSTPLGVPTLVVDVGSNSIDLAVHDGVIRLTNTIALGGDNLTDQLMKDLSISREQANEIKYKFGLGKSGLQDKVKSSLTKPLQIITSEMKRVMRYYLDRGKDKKPVQAIILSGGSASMPGLVEHLAKELGLPVTVANSWNGLGMKNIQAISKFDAPMYTTAIGLARLESEL